MKETIRQLASFFAYGGKLQLVYLKHSMEDQTPSWDKPPQGQVAALEILDDKERLWTDKKGETTLSASGNGCYDG